MPDPTIAEKVEDWSAVGEQVASGFATYVARSDLAKVIATLVADVVGVLVATGVTLTAPIGVGLAKGIAQSEDLVAGSLSGMAAAAVNDMFGVNVPASAFEGGIQHGKRTSASDALAAGLLQQLRGTASSLEPDDAAATRYLGVVVNMALEGWYQKWFFEFITSLVPQLDIGKIENFGSLDDKMAQALGIGRLTRRVLSPIVDTTIVEPLRWQTNKTYRPNLLAAADVVRQVSRGRWTEEQGREELARQGWSEDRIAALFNAQRKFFGAGDVRTFVDRAHWTREQGIQHLKDQGYDLDTAEDALRLEGLHRFEQLEGQEATALISAYASRDIERGEFLAQLETNVSSPTERALFAELGELRRTLNIKPLSSGEVAAAVEAEILAFPDYVAALRREGYVEPAVTVKELLLRARIDTTKTIAQHRAAVEAARALEQAQRDVEQKAKRAQVEADRLKKRRGSVSDLERATVIGLIPIARYEEVIAGDYDADTVDIMVGLVEDERQKYVTQQQRAADAAQRVNRRGLDVGQLQQAVLSNLLTIPEFSARLTQLGFDPSDVSILAETLAVRKHDQDMARQKRDDAAAAAARRSIDLPKLETLVRKGIQPIDAYAAQLEALGYDEADRADLVALLEQRIAEDRAAEAARRAQADQADAGELTIDQFRRSVLLGLQSMSAFDLFLTTTGVNADVHALLVAELEDDLAQAEAARRRRDAAAATNGPRELPLDVVARAARLGIVSVSVYQDRLARAGYSPDDIALETELLTTEIADVQAARQQRDALPFTIGEKGLTLAQLAVAVKAGVRPLEDYRAAAITAGLKADAVETLVRVLGDELRETQAAKVRREQLGSELDARGTSLAVLGDQVRSGALTLDAYFEQLVALGIAPEDADVLWTLLSDELAGGPVSA